MIAVRFSTPGFRIKTENGKRFIFDEIRKAWLFLTEEEWVRQNFVHYLVHELHYPAPVIALEKEIRLNDLRKRFDILVYGRTHRPWMLVECKEPALPLSESVLQQALRYNMSVPVQYIVITNGTTTIGWAREDGGMKLLSEMPPY